MSSLPRAFVLVRADMTSTDAIVPITTIESDVSVVDLAIDIPTAMTTIGTFSGNAIASKVPALLAPSTAVHASAHIRAHAPLSHVWPSLTPTPVSAAPY